VTAKHFDVGPHGRRQARDIFIADATALVPELAQDGVHDVIDREWKVEIRRGDSAVFTSSACPLPREVFKRTIHLHSMNLGRTVALPAFE
jgi:hypothetical protein